jgi:hypothetical protein
MGSCSPWNPIPLNARRTVMVLPEKFVARRSSRMIISLDVWQVSRTTFFSARRSLSVTKLGLPSSGFVVVVPSHFHLKITSPSVDLGNLRKVAMSLTDLLLMLQPVTSPFRSYWAPLTYSCCWYSLVMSNT